MDSTTNEAAAVGPSRKKSERGVVYRGVWTSIDQVFSSLSNVALGILVARSVSPSSFGLFALAYSIYLFTGGVCRAVVSEPLVVRHSVQPHGMEARRAASGSLGAALLLSLISSAALLASTPLLDGPGRAVVIALAASMPGALVQDAYRFIFFARGTPRPAAINDIFWFFSQIAFVTLVARYLDSSTAALVGAWGLSALLSAGLASAQAHALPDYRATLAWFRGHVDLWPRFAAEYAIGGGARQAVLWVVGAAAGISASGALRSAELLLGPIRVVLMSATALAVPEGARTTAGSIPAVRRYVRRLALLLAAGAAAWGSVLVVLPERIGRLALAESWPGAHRLMLPLAVTWIAFSTSSAHLVGLRILAAARLSLRARSIDGALMALLPLLGALVNGALGAAVGSAIAAMTAAVVWRFVFNRATESAAELADAELTSGGPRKVKRKHR